MGSTGETTTYAELEDRSGRLARRAAGPRRRRRRPHRHPHGEQPPVPRGGVGGPAIRAPLHGHQQPPAPGRGAVRARRLRRGRARVVGGDGRRRRRARPRPHPGAGGRGRRPRGFERYDDVLAGEEPRPARRRARGPRDALLVGHHRPAEGRAQGAAGHAVRRPVGGAGADRPGRWRSRGRARFRVPLARAAVPRRAARLLDVDAAPRRHRRGDGAVRPRAVPRADRAPPGDPRPVRADDVRAHAAAARGRARRATTCRACRWRARRGAVPGRRSSGR